MIKDFNTFLESGLNEEQRIRKGKKGFVAAHVKMTDLSPLGKTCQ